MTNEEFLNTMEACGKIMSYSEEDMEVIKNTEVNMGEVYKRIKTFMDKNVKKNDMYEHIMYQILLIFGRIRLDHYYDGDYSDLLDTIFNVFLTSYSDIWLRSVDLHYEFLRMNKNLVYEIKLRDFKKKVVTSDISYNGNTISTDDSNELYLVLNGQGRYNYIILKDGKLIGKRCEYNRYIEIIERILSEKEEDDYDLIYIPYDYLDKMREDILYYYKNIEIDNKTYFRIINLLGMIDCTDTRLWKKMDKILDCGLDLREALRLLFNKNVNDLRFMRKIDMLDRIIGLIRKEMRYASKEEIEATIRKRIAKDLKPYKKNGFWG